MNSAPTVVRSTSVFKQLVYVVPPELMLGTGIFDESTKSAARHQRLVLMVGAIPFGWLIFVC